ncbi:hypothetical protein [Dysgonomonas macrotermitis]|uniref:hypothetical protein n=1 Tax=Dysgonomonas macrotermitis TaxID=1346286 RepID=UPI0007845907|nr:hypothetical protein [Dysgonomonas macrotermitis]
MNINTTPEEEKRIFLTIISLLIIIFLSSVGIASTYFPDRDGLSEMFLLTGIFIGIPVFMWTLTSIARQCYTKGSKTYFKLSFITSLMKYILIPYLIIASGILFFLYSMGSGRPFR